MPVNLESHRCVLHLYRSSQSCAQFSLLEAKMTMKTREYESMRVTGVGSLFRKVLKWY